MNQPSDGLPVVNEIRLRVRYAETDQMGIVYHSNHFIWFEIGRVELLRRLRRLADENRYTVLVVTHELNLAAEFSDRIVLLHKGKCLRVGTPAEVYDRPLLEEVFEAPLDVEMRASGRPRVMLRGDH